MDFASTHVSGFARTADGVRVAADAQCASELRCDVGNAGHSCVAYGAAQRATSFQRGFSRVEVICIVGICAFVVAGLLLFAAYGLGLFRGGDDANTMNTAESVAYTTLADNCIVPGCGGSGLTHDTKHIDAMGRNYACYDKVKNTLTDERPAGYNEGTTLTIDGLQRQVEPNTMIIVAYRDGMDYYLTWERSLMEEQ